MPQYQGVWSLQQQMQALTSGQWATDPLFDYTTLLLQADDAANSAQNNTFLDSSTNAFAITRNGNTTQGTFSPFSATGWSNYFSGSQSLSNATSVTASGDFTLECWLRLDSYSAARIFFSVGNETTNRRAFFIDSSGVIKIDLISVGATSLGGVVPLNTWTHIAITRSGSTVTAYVNGIATGTTGTISGTFGNANGFYIGSVSDNSNSMVGYISNFRWVLGSVVYTSNFTPPTSPLTSITNTSILTCQSSRFVDNSTNAYALTVNGTPSVQAFSPFAPQFQYTASVTGGSGYFDGSGDFLTAADNTAFQFGTGTLTVEFWYFPVASLTNAGLVDMRASGSSSAGLLIRQGDGSSSGTQITCWAGNPASTTAATQTGLNINQWNHVAVVRDGSNNLQVFVNGSGGTAVARSINLSDQSLRIAAFVDASASPNAANGYISNLRIVKGTAVYTGAFSPPIAPLSTSGSASSSAYSSTTNVNTTFAASNTSLLLNFTNAGILDGTMKNNLETVGNAQVSTSVVKYGSGSMYFDGTGDRLAFPTSQNAAFGTGDFTVEMWVYPNSFSTSPVLFDTRNVSTNTAAIALTFDTSGNPKVYVNGGFLITGSSPAALSSWSHLAMVKLNGVIRLYLNGVSVGSSSSSTSLTDTAITIGDSINTAGAFNGYIDDLRITKGIARYTQNFIPPSVALPRQ